MPDSSLKWHGGKTYLAKKIIALMPGHTHYVEPYAGGLSVLLAKPEEGISEVVNDLDGELVNFWRVLAMPLLFSSFQRIIEATPFSQEIFDAASLPCLDIVARAVRFFIRCRQSRQGLQKDFATLSKNRTRRGMNEQVSSWLTAVEGLADVHARLKRVVIFHDDALNVIKKEDSYNTFFYLDPPYMHDTRVTTGDYKHEMTHDDHLALLSLLKTIKGRFILSGYINATYLSMCHQWNRVDIEIDCKASSADEKPMRTESLWYNY